MTANRLVGAIIAGGASSRFGGAPKGLQSVGGQRIIDRVANALRVVTGDLILVSNDPHAPSWIPGVPVVPDARADRGSLVGLHTALSWASKTVVVAAWDMPFVTGTLLELIVRRGRDERFATLPSGVNGPEPFFAMYTQGCLPIIEDALDAGDLRMSRVLRRFPSRTIIARDEFATLGDPERLFFNVNTAEQLLVAEQMASGE